MLIELFLKHRPLGGVMRGWCWGGVSECGSGARLLRLQTCLYIYIHIHPDGWRARVWGVQALRRLARAACAWLEAIRPDQVCSLRHGKQNIARHMLCRLIYCSTTAVKLGMKWNSEMGCCTSEGTLNSHSREVTAIPVFL
jgi:hypothetical protein